MSKTKMYLSDFQASIVVFLVALPLCLGISLASGAPLLSGIIAGMMGGLVVGSLSKSHTSVSGPAAGLTVIVLSGITALNDFYSFTLAVFIAGIIQIVFGILKIGKVGGYFPTSVIKGMLAAIGIILILKQIPHAVGFDNDFMGDESFFQFDGENTFSEILLAFKALHPGAVILSSISILCMILWEKFAKKGLTFFKLFPGPLFAVILGVLVNHFIFINFESLYIESSHLVSLPVEGGFASLFDSFRLPNWDAFTNPLIYKIAITIALVASIETLLSVEAVDKLDVHKRRTDKEKELIAQGVGNISSGLLGGLPVTSVIVRSSANVNSGAESKLSAIFHGLWLVLAVALIPSLLEMIPLATLAAILLLVGYKLSTPTLFKEMKKSGSPQFYPFVITIIAILFTDLLTGIFIGLITGFYFVIKANSKKTIVVVHEENNYLVRFIKDVSFLQKPYMSNILDEIPDNSSVIIDGTNHVYIDDDIISLIEDFIEVCHERNIKCELLKSTLAINNFFKV